MDVDAFKVHSKCMFLNVLTKRNACNIKVHSVREEKLINRISFRNKLNTK